MYRATGRTHTAPCGWTTIPPYHGTYRDVTSGLTDRHNCVRQPDRAMLPRRYIEGLKYLVFSLVYTWYATFDFIIAYVA